MTKRCYKCKGVKEKSEFNKDRSTKDGHDNMCRLCKKEYRENNREAIREQKKEYYKNNREAIRERDRERYKNNREAMLKRQKEYYNKNREVLLEQLKGYKKSNRDKINTWVANRRAIKRNACPDWLTQEHHSAIAELYSEAQKLTEETGIPHHVDHIVPLKGKSYDLGTKRMRHTISGLHVPWNLQVVSEEENLSKGCRYSEWK